jgi:repressor of nif and glnA expression
LRAETCEVLRGVVVTNMAEVSRAMDLAVPIVSAVVASHFRVVNSVAVIKGFLGGSMRVGGGRWT